jgi:hypothetical protein
MQINGSKSGVILDIESYTTKSIQLPMVFRYNFNYKRGNIIPYIDLGLLLDIKIGKKEGVIFRGSQNGDILPNTEMSPFRYGAVLGGGIEYRLNPKHSIYAGLRFRYVKGDGVDESMETQNYLSVNIAYGF